MMKQLFNGAVAHFLISVVSLVPPSFGGEVDYETSKAFYADYLKFDYCGTNGIVRTERGAAHEKILPLMVRFQTEDIARDRAFYEVLRRFEVTSMADRSVGLDNGVEVGRLLMSFDAEIKSTKPLTFWSYVSRVEYSLLRIIEIGTVEVDVRVIENVLPDELFKSDSMSARYPDRESVHRAFKNMIVVASALGKWKRNFGSFPTSLLNLDIGDKWTKGILGADLEYRVVGGVWQLFSPGVPGGKDKGRFNEYVPVVCADGAGFWPQTSCLWLSSDFSAKRRRLYETGTLYDATSPCACKLERGCIVRQDRGSRVKAH